MTAKRGTVVKVGALGSAVFSADDVYRFSLERNPESRDLPPWIVTWIALNPSTADADKNDHTITKETKFSMLFAEERGIASSRVGLRKANLFAYRATDPDVCKAAPKKIGGLVNDEAIVEACHGAELVVAAWGATSWAQERAREVTRMLVANGIQLWCIGTTKDGSPKHPLMVPYSAKLVRWA